jgi:hypothetical protein
VGSDFQALTRTSCSVPYPTNFFGFGIVSTVMIGTKPGLTSWADKRCHFQRHILAHVLNPGTVMTVPVAPFNVPVIVPAAICP